MAGYVDWLHLPAQAEGSVLSCDQLSRTHIEGQAGAKAVQSRRAQAGEKQAALRRGLHAHIAAHAHHISPVSLFAYDRTWPHHHSSHICEGDDTSEFGVNIG